MLNDKGIVEQKIRKKNNKKYFISFFILIVLILITFYSMFKDYSIKELFSALALVNKKFIIIASIIPFVYILIQALSSKIILKTLGEKVNIFKTISYSSIDLYFCAITPAATGGQPMALYYMVNDNIESTKAIASLLLNTAAFRFVLLVLGITSVCFYSGILFDGSVVFPVFFVIGLMVNLLMVLACVCGIYHTSLIKKIGCKCIRLISKARKKCPEKLLCKFDNKMLEYEDIGRFIMQHKFLFLVVFLLNCIQRMLFFSISYFIYRGFGFNQENVFKLIAMQAIISVAVDSLPIPGGMLLTEKLMEKTYANFYPNELVMPSILSTRICGYYFLLIITMLIFFVKMFVNYLKKRKKCLKLNKN